MPSEIELLAYVYGNANEASILGSGESPANGASFTFTTDQPITAGLHYVQVQPVTNPHAYGPGSTPASYVTRPYSLVVTQ